MLYCKKWINKSYATKLATKVPLSRFLTTAITECVSLKRINVICNTLSAILLNVSLDYRELVFALLPDKVVAATWFDHWFRKTLYCNCADQCNRLYIGLWLWGRNLKPCWCVSNMITNIISDIWRDAHRKSNNVIMMLIGTEPSGTLLNRHVRTSTAVYDNYPIIVFSRRAAYCEYFLRKRIAIRIISCSDLFYTWYSTLLNIDKQTSTL